MSPQFQSTAYETGTTARFFVLLFLPDIFRRILPLR